MLARLAMVLPDISKRMTAPTDARQVRSRAALRAALLALLEERPFDQITIRDLSARSGTGYATFFRHYPTKEDLLADVASAEIAGLLGMALPLVLSGSGVEAASALCRHVAGHRALWAALLNGGAAAIVRAEYIRQARQMARGLPGGPGWLPRDLAIVHGAGSTLDVLAWWLAQPGTLDPDALAAILDRLVIAPLVGTTARPN